MRQLRQRARLTLIEIILVIIVIGILAAIVIPKFGNQAEKAKIARTKANILTIRSAVRLYQADHDGALPSALTDLVPDYLPEIPFEAITETAVETTALTGTGGWVYDSGDVRVNLSGTDDEGTDFSKY